MAIKIIQKIKNLKTPMMCIFLLLLAIPACGDELLHKIETNNFNKSISYNKTRTALLSNKIRMLANITSTNNGFVLCELMNSGATKLNLCYLKKNLKTKPILDFNRLFLEVKLHF